MMKSPSDSMLDPDWIDREIVKVPAFEPAGQVVRLTSGDLLQHLLITGATGSGKTTVLNRILHQLISLQDPTPSLIILDAKGDETAQKIRDWAAAVNRPVTVLDGSGAAHFPLFSDLQTFDDLEPVCRRLLLGSQSMGPQNEYWNEFRSNLIEMALGCMLVFHSERDFSTVMSKTRELLFGKNSRKQATAYAHDLDGLILRAGARLKAREVNGIARLRNELETWSCLDSRTSVIHQSTLQNALSPLSSGIAAGYFQGEGKPIDMHQVLADGGILVISVNALTHPKFATLIFRLIKDAWMKALAERRTTHASVDSPTFLVVDEYPLAATDDDVVTLQTIRSRRGSVIATTQSLVGLDLVVGPRIREALVANFGNLLFFRSQDPAVDLLALGTMGTKPSPQPPTPPGPQLGQLVIDWNPSPQLLIPVCPLGSLSRLQVHQAYVRTASKVHPDALWLEPLYYHQAVDSCTEAKPFSIYDALGEFRIKDISEPSLEALLKAQYELHAAAKDDLQPTESVQRALRYFRPMRSKKRLLERARRFFRSHHLNPLGLESLPSVWLAGLPEILLAIASKHGELRIPFAEFYIEDGFLLFRQEMNDADDIPALPPIEVNPAMLKRVRRHLQHVLYPSRVRPIKRQHLALLKKAAR